MPRAQPKRILALGQWPGGLIVLVVPGTATEYGGALTGAVIWRKAADLVWGSFFDPIRYRRADQLIGAALLA